MPTYYYSRHNVHSSRWQHCQTLGARTRKRKYSVIPTPSAARSLTPVETMGSLPCMNRDARPAFFARSTEGGIHLEDKKSGPRPSYAYLHDIHTYVHRRDAAHKTANQVDATVVSTRCPQSTTAHTAHRPRTVLCGHSTQKQTRQQRHIHVLLHTTNTFGLRWITPLRCIGAAIVVEGLPRLWVHVLFPSLGHHTHEYRSGSAHQQSATSTVVGGCKRRKTRGRRQRGRE